MVLNPPRHMKYTYTLMSSLRQFPYRYYFNNNWIYRYYCYSAVLCFPIFAYIHKMTHTPENYAKYEEFKRKENAEHH